MLAGIFDFAAKRIHDVMQPRTDIVALHIDDDEAEVTALLRRERYSRYPVYDESLDDIVGVFLSKDLWLRERDRPFQLRDFLREPLLVPASRSAERVLDDLRRTRAQMAVVLDEFGGTAGIVTMEDLIEEVIGDIADEYDMASRDAVEVDGVLELAGALSLVDVRSDHRLAIPDGEWTTLGGYVFARLGHVPSLGERALSGVNWRSSPDKRVAAVRVHRLATPPEPDRTYDATATSAGRSVAHLPPPTMTRDRRATRYPACRALGARLARGRSGRTARQYVVDPRRAALGSRDLTGAHDIERARAREAGRAPRGRGARADRGQRYPEPEAEPSARRSAPGRARRARAGGPPYPQEDTTDARLDRTPPRDQETRIAEKAGPRPKHRTDGPLQSAIDGAASRVGAGAPRQPRPAAPALAPLPFPCASAPATARAENPGRALR
jgi:Mg2+/Co2+ transporter CorC